MSVPADLCFAGMSQNACCSGQVDGIIIYIVGDWGERNGYIERAILAEPPGAKKTRLQIYHIARGAGTHDGTRHGRSH